MACLHEAFTVDTSCTLRPKTNILDCVYLHVWWHILIHSRLTTKFRNRDNISVPSRWEFSHGQCRGGHRYQVITMGMYTNCVYISCQLSIPLFHPSLTLPAWTEFILRKPPTPHPFLPPEFIAIKSSVYMKSEQGLSYGYSSLMIMMMKSYHILYFP